MKARETLAVTSIVHPEAVATTAALVKVPVSGEDGVSSSDIFAPPTRFKYCAYQAGRRTVLLRFG